MPSTIVTVQSLGDPRAVELPDHVIASLVAMHRRIARPLTQEVDFKLREYLEQDVQITLRSLCSKVGIRTIHFRQWINFGEECAKYSVVNEYTRFFLFYSNHILDMCDELEKTIFAHATNRQVLGEGEKLPDLRAAVRFLEAYGDDRWRLGRNTTDPKKNAKGGYDEVPEVVWQTTDEELPENAVVAGADKRQKTRMQERIEQEREKSPI